MRVSLRVGASTERLVPASILGQNIELCPAMTATILSNRLCNPRFLGPAHHHTGLAVPWIPRPTVTQAGMQCTLVPGMGLAGSEAQLIQTFRPHMKNMGLQQTPIPIRAGERLEVELWAKPWHRPVSLVVGLSSTMLRGGSYVRAEFEVDAGYWKPYRATLEVPRDDPRAAFFITVQGEGMVYLDQVHLRPQGQPLLARDTLDVLNSIQVPVLRFPGGSKTTIYHWRHGVGPIERRPVLPDPVHKSFVDYDFGTDEYLQLCVDQGIMPHITVNVGSGTPEDAAAWAEYCAAWFRSRGIEPPPAYWQIGNEQDMVHESSHMTGPMYVQALRDFVPGVRRGYRNARIIAVGAESSAGVRQEFETPWRQLILQEVPDLVDVLSMQAYKGQLRDTPAEQQLNAVESARKLGDTLQKLIDDIDAAGQGRITACCTEWNYWLTCSPGEPNERFAAMHGFFVAAALNRFTRMAPRFELSSFYQMFSGLGYIRREGLDLRVLCLAEVFRLYRPAYPGTLVEVHSDAPALIGDDPAVGAIALRNDAGLWLLIANRSPIEPAEIELPDIDTSAANATMLAAPDPLAQLQPQAYRIGDPLPPLSMLRLHLPQ